jgi:two-component system, OmpR family, response regulator
MPVNMKILLVEDDQAISAYLAQGLREIGHVVDCAASGRDGLFLASSPDYDVLVIDRLLPEIEGANLVRSLRSAAVKTPVLFLTALSRVDQRVEGFAAGGDDYLVKPFAFSEFLARLTALARRPPLVSVLAHLSCGDISMDRLKRRVWVKADEIDLQAREFQLLEILLLHKNEIVTRTMLLEKLWGFHFDPQTNIVETHISRLRSKLGPAKAIVQTVRGSGYVARETPC